MNSDQKDVQMYEQEITSQGVTLQVLLSDKVGRNGGKLWRMLPPAADGRQVP